MSRFVAGFALIFYVCVVSGQQYPRIRLKGTGDEASIAIDHIHGGSYPAGSFSIGHGEDNANGDGGPGADFGVNGGQGQNEGGYVHGQNDIGSYGAGNVNNPPNNGVNEYGVPLQNPGQKPTHPYDDQYNQHDTNKVPVKNSATRNTFLSRLWRFILSWF